MKIGTLLLIILTAAFILTMVSNLLLRKNKRTWLAFLQYFCGVLFLISGYVKAVDPLGTAFKMEQYFAEFEFTFKATWFSFLSPLFPVLSGSSTLFSLVVIALEIAIGLFLIIGIWRKLTAWAFFLIILFFTVLTGFTYLTGYVPSGENFFSFSQWSTFQKSNMRVQDCGCFGDFIKLDPKVSFFKDVFLLIPAILFLLYWRDFRQFFALSINKVIAWAGIAVTLLFCLRNVYWDEPITDFRPFRKGVNLREQRNAEDEAMATVPMTMVMKRKSDGSIVRLPQEEYMKVFKDYPKDQYEYLEPEKGEPSIPITKISDFNVSDADGADVAYGILDEEGYAFLVIAYDLKKTGVETSTVMVSDTIWAHDTLQTAEGLVPMSRIDHIDQRAVVNQDFSWNPGFISGYKDKVVPMLKLAAADGHSIYMISKYADSDMIEDLKSEIGYEGPWYQADDILLKTMIRSNPGVILLHNGMIVEKWHIRHLPNYQEIKSKHLK